MNSSGIILEALSFAAERHKNQIRKGMGKVPYINHPIEVTRLLSRFGETNEDLLIAALLHDVIEDTTNNKEEIKELSELILKKFGEVVLLTVLEVSDNKSLPVEERKDLQVIHTPNLSNLAKKLKIADKTCNILDIKNDPPESWTTQRKMNYLEWSKEVVNGARGINEELDQNFDQVHNNVYRFLKES
jgi:guanosine-3',5'-bis(diphosphate) 3'-pyrophosphohydrolase